MKRLGLIVSLLLNFQLSYTSLRPRDVSGIASSQAGFVVAGAFCIGSGMVVMIDAMHKRGTNSFQNDATIQQFFDGIGIVALGGVCMAHALTTPRKSRMQDDVGNLKQSDLEV